MTKRLHKLGAKIGSVSQLIETITKGGAVALGGKILPPRVALALSLAQAVSAIAGGLVRRVRKGDARGTDNKEGTR